MSRPIRLLAFGLTLSFLFSQVAEIQAQNSSPQINVVLQSADKALADLKLLSDLTTKTEQKQWENIHDIIQTFLFGVDTKRPATLSILLDQKEERYRGTIPISNFKEFQAENLGGFEIKTRKLATSLYRLGDKTGTLGYLRYKSRNAAIATERRDVTKVVAPAKQMASLLAKNYLLAASIRNRATGQAARRKAIATIRTNLVTAMAQKKDETPEDFALRKQLLLYVMQEAERFFVESSALTMGLTIDHTAKQARVDLDLGSLPDTTLSGSIQQLSAESSHFASVSPPDDAILSARINHPLDQLRRTGLQAVLDASRTAIKKDIQENSTATDSQKAASTKLLEIILAVIQSGLQKGILDGFIDVHPAANDNHTLVAGIRTIDGTRLQQALAVLPDSTLKLSVKIDVEKSEDVTVHSVSVPARFHDDFKVLFGDSNTIFVGTSDNAAWCAAGPGALKALRSAIAAQKETRDGPVNPVFVDLAVKVGPWLKIIDQHLGTKGEAADRKLALAAFKQGGDTLQLQLKRTEETVKGQTTLGTGILRFLGKKMAEFSKENFE